MQPTSIQVELAALRDRLAALETDASVLTAQSAEVDDDLARLRAGLSSARKAAAEVAWRLAASNRMSEQPPAPVASAEADTTG